MSNLIAIKNFMNQANVKEAFEKQLGKKAKGFVTSVMQVIASNKMLQDVDQTTIYQSAMMAAVLDLPINNNLGFAYIVPYKDQAQFQMGYKGFIQLAQRSGKFKTISAAAIYDGQIISNNPLKGIEFDFSVEQKGDPIGYCAYFSLLNGFESYYYMSKKQMIAHSNKYSKSAKKGFGVWKDEFDSMAKKTVIKHLLSKYAPLSIEMEKAVISDQAVIKDAELMEVEYQDNPKELIPTKQILTQDHPQFLAVKEQFHTGEKSLEEICEKFDMSDEVRGLIVESF